MEKLHRSRLAIFKPASVKGSSIVGPSTTSPAIDAALSLLQSVVPVLLTTEAQLASRASKLSSAAIV
ncbi:hypothetical protein F444_06427 [Phytophthora nicotianae P1976]|uniref:Uncharacterized protein n=1 Tax=Phytophthora nicotianae P1976 TaxID=1317066 RepID=A0A081AIK0_PHYNI|nr:hypothetical protein F444_06427 [Phytophthora nicotianae P1976]